MDRREGERLIHTSCSQPICPGMTRGAFVVVEGASRGGGLLCPLPKKGRRNREGTRWEGLRLLPPGCFCAWGSLGPVLGSQDGGGARGC